MALQPELVGVIEGMKLIEPKFMVAATAQGFAPGAVCAEFELAARIGALARTYARSAAANIRKAWEEAATGKGLLTDSVSWSPVSRRSVSRRPIRVLPTP
jgi:hypothetical protein